VFEEDLLIEGDERSGILVKCNTIFGLRPYGLQVCLLDMRGVPQDCIGFKIDW
jgi:hypothetical protein